MKEALTMRYRWLFGTLLAVLMAGAAWAHDFTSTTRIGTVAITLNRTGAGVSSVRAYVTSDDGAVVKSVDVLAHLTAAQKGQVRDAYDMMVNALAAAAGIPTPVPTPSRTTTPTTTATP